MSETSVDEVTALRTGTGAAPRATMDENVSSDGSTTEQHAAGVQNESQRDVRVGGRVVKESTQKLLDALETAGEDAGDPDDVGLVDDAPAGETTTEGAETAEGETPPVEDVWQAKAAKLEEANRRLAGENESLRKQPRAARSERDTALAEAEQAYVDEGPIAAVRKFLSVVLGTKEDAKDVDAELSGLYTDLTARELQVPLEASHQALREAARARLALARDKRERKQEATAAASVPQPEDTQVDQAATLIESRLTAKQETGKSFADDHPMMMKFAQKLDGMTPQKLIANVIKREIQIGALDPTIGNDELIKAAAQKIENHYKSLADQFGKTPSKTTTDTAKAGDKTATATKTSTDQRQKPGAPKLSNASASVAPATSPKTKTPTTAPEEKPKFKNDKERRAYALRHLPG